MSAYLYQLTTSFTHQHPLFVGVEFNKAWLFIRNDQLIIKRYYARDSCTSKWQPLGLFTLDIPDGSLRYVKPWVCGPSLVHNALCQFLQQLPFSQQQATEIL